MAYANSNFDAIVTTTLKNRTGKVADNVTANNSVLAELSRKEQHHARRWRSIACPRT
jgi:hypothetical protein